MNQTNKNPVFYPQNKNKSNKKQFYYSTKNIYIKEITEINKKFIQGVDNIILMKSIDNLLNKMNLMKDFQNYKTYLPLKNLLIYIDNNFTRCKEEEILEIKEKEVESIIVSDNKEVFITNKINIESNLKLNQDYIKYIKEYGLPENGIFLPSKLYLIKKS